MMEYERYVYIILRADKVRAVFSRAATARNILNKLREYNMPDYRPNVDLEEYMAACSDEYAKWRVEKWPILRCFDE